MAVVERRRHEVGRLVAGEAEHDALVAGALVLVLAGIDALRDVRRLRVQMVGEVEAVPVEALLLVADALHDAAHRLLDLLADAGRPIAVLVHDALAADLAGKDDAVGRRHRLAGDARLRILRQEQVDDRVGNLVGDLVGMAFGNGFGREQVRAAHERRRVLGFEDIRKALYDASSGGGGPSTMPPMMSTNPSRSGMRLPNRANGVGEFAAGGRTASITPAVRHGSDFTTLPRASITALMPVGVARSTGRPSSAARSRAWARCCGGPQRAEPGVVGRIEDEVGPVASRRRPGPEKMIS